MKTKWGNTRMTGRKGDRFNQLMIDAPAVTQIDRSCHLYEVEEGMVNMLQRIKNPAPGERSAGFYELPRKYFLWFSGSGVAILNPLHTGEKN